MIAPNRLRMVAAVMMLALFAIRTARGSDCTVTSVGFTPVNDLGTGLYLSQFEGGLYPGGSNLVPAMHAAEGRARALSIQPLDVGGNPSPTGKYVLLSIGMSNTTQEFCSQGGGLPCNSWTFMGQAAANSRINHAQLTIANGALGGQVTASWDSPTDPNYDRVRDNVLTPQGLSEAQVQAVWVKCADAQPTAHLPNSNADAYILEGLTGSVMRACKIRYPNLTIAFVSSRIYAGYAGYPNPTASTLNPEPYAYESGFAMKWLIEAQINQMGGGPVDPIAGDLNYNTVAPWIAWGPYLWADGLTPRSDGLRWQCADIENDGTHPATGGETKVGSMLLNFMLASRFATPWFRTCEPGDMNGDGLFDTADIAPFVDTLLHPAAATDAQRCAADCNGDGQPSGLDISPFVKILLGG